MSALHPIAATPSLRGALAQAVLSSVKRAAVSGTLAGLLSMGVMARRGRQETGSAVAPINAPSHWVYGDKALVQDDASLRYTLPGALIHQASGVFWGLLFDQLLRGGAGRNIKRVALAAAGTTAIAAAVDLKLVPQRLTPGFERRLSSRSVFLTYGAFAVGLALGGLLLRGRR